MAHERWGSLAFITSDIFLLNNLGVILKEGSQGKQVVVSPVGVKLDDMFTWFSIFLFQRFVFQL